MPFLTPAGQRRAWPRCETWNTQLARNSAGTAKTCRIPHRMKKARISGAGNNSGMGRYIQALPPRATSTASPSKITAQPTAT